MYLAHQCRPGNGSATRREGPVLVWRLPLSLRPWVVSPVLALLCCSASAAGLSAVSRFRQEVQPLLEEHCYDCHGDGANKGGIAFDQLKTDPSILNHELWLKVLNNIRAGLMPPPKKPRLPAIDEQQLEAWIKFGVFGIHANNPDPGRVTLRRLNRVEYRNTIHDLLGVTFNANFEFPPDDTGYGFDNIGDVLTVSPMLLEKYLAAALTIVKEAMPDPEQTPTATVPIRNPGTNDRSQSLLAACQQFLSQAPQASLERGAYARQWLTAFATRAFRRPVDPETADRLVALAQGVWNQPGKTFAGGIRQATAAVLASPRFLFRLEQPDPVSATQTFAAVDEFSLASRLSYFLWSSTPDDELLHLAGAGQLRHDLQAQVRRMLADPRSEQFICNFTGQWLRTRDVQDTPIDALAVLARDNGQEAELARRHGLLSPNVPGNWPRVRLDHELREAMRRETEMFFAAIVHEDRPVTELIDSDYTFLNEKLARLYGIENVTGPEMRRVTLPAGSPRGGVLTDGSVLVVTSNPTRTSPVKRGLFILENFLGSPPPPPPPNTPPLELAERKTEQHQPTLREALQMHRDQPSCAVCHARMDELGLAFENFNAMGMWRDQERHQQIDASGQLLSGESFTGVGQLKSILAHQHRTEFYRCLTQKLLTYAVGRGMEYYDTETIDQIVQRLQRSDGRFSALLNGVIESAPFQKMRTRATPTISAQASESSEHAAVSSTAQAKPNS
ncbi:MAG TPA: DUF1592 domain-containing protein [Verrucomicrobiae bacterium]|nr:DUF1592 domain-containing protein [Verrucomicrobiae bacterium]